jgi:hypothetical protein
LTNTLSDVDVRAQGLRKHTHHDFDLRGSFRLSVSPDRRKPESASLCPPCLGGEPGFDRRQFCPKTPMKSEKIAGNSKLSWTAMRQSIIIHLYSKRNKRAYQTKIDLITAQSSVTHSALSALRSSRINSMACRRLFLVSSIVSPCPLAPGISGQMAQ